MNAAIIRQTSAKEFVRTHTEVISVRVTSVICYKVTTHVKVQVSLVRLPMLQWKVKTNDTTLCKPLKNKRNVFANFLQTDFF